MVKVYIVRKIEVIPSMFFNHNVLRLDINCKKKKKMGKSTNIWQLGQRQYKRRDYNIHRNKRE